MVTIVVITAAMGLPQPAEMPALPPADSPPVIRTIEIAFPTQGNTSLIDPATYLHAIQTRPSRPSVNSWVLYDKAALREDFRRVWATGFLDNLSIEERDVPYPNGVMGKHITFNLEERQRVKMVDYVGTKVLERSAIEERLVKANVAIRLDTFIDALMLRKVESIVRDMLHEKGYQRAEVTHSLESLESGPRLVRLTFHMREGPLVRVKSVDVPGAKSISPRIVRRQVRQNRSRRWWLPSFLDRGHVFQEEKLEEDVDRVVQYYRDRGFIGADVRGARAVPAGTSKDGRTEWVRVVLPVVEGARYSVGALNFEGNSRLSDAQLAPLFKLRPGDVYSEAGIRRGFERARELYGAGGYFEFTGYPDLAPRDDDRTVGVTIRFVEGPQYRINRIAFAGNTVTRDAVMRREMALAEGGVFDTEALKTSIRRLNQLGYFKPLEAQSHVQVDKVAGVSDRVDLTLKVEEQNRNQVSFGAGVSQFEGVFGNLSYTTANFLGRGENLTIALQKGSRSNSYQLGFTEPYLFNRPIIAGANAYSRKYDYVTSPGVVGYSEVREGASVTAGWMWRRFARASLDYTYDIANIAISDELAANRAAAAQDSPLFNPLDAGLHIDSRLTPSLVHNTVDHPVFPHRGIRLTGSVGVAGRALRGSYNYVRPEVEAVWFLPTTRRTGFGFRAQGGWLRTYGTTDKVPYYLRYFLGGETQIRGVNIRTVGPVDEDNTLVGGNKFALFNAEYYIDIVGPVRALLFHDAGQAYLESKPVDLRQLRTSTGVELRVMMPVLNVPFRLIWSANRYRDTFQKPYTFRFAVGTTF